MPTHSPYASVAATKEVLDAYGLSTKKALGQHFLINDGIVGKILETAEVGSKDCIIEVGPGIGTLTYALLKQAGSVVALERDRDMIAILQETCADYSDTFTLINKDALKVSAADFGEVVLNKFVANLPYAVAATLVLDFFQTFEHLQSATVMVQNEVASRMCAQPGTKEYGAYTVKLSLYAEPRTRFTVGPQNFFPPPRVDSAVIKLDRNRPLCKDGTPITDEVCRATCIMADAAFANRRKTILNSMKSYFAARKEPNEVILDKVPAILLAAQVDPSLRGERLTRDDFLRLGQSLCAQMEGKGLFNRTYF